MQKALEESNKSEINVLHEVFKRLGNAKADKGETLELEGKLIKKLEFLKFD
jgi:hypothetical protein